MSLNVAPSITVSSDQVAIDIPRRKDDWRPDPRDLSQTPGGTLYAVTPGGTKIIYNRDKLMALAQSPLSKSPITLPFLPGVTSPSTSPSSKIASPLHAAVAKPKSGKDSLPEHAADDALFDMDN